MVKSRQQYLIFVINKTVKKIYTIAKHHKANKAIFTNIHISECKLKRKIPPIREGLKNYCINSTSLLEAIVSVCEISFVTLAL